MTDPGAKRRIPLIPAVVVLLVLGAAAFLILRKDGGGPLPMPPPDRYAEMVSAFYTGTVALIVQDKDRPEAELKRATGIVPDEPAPWANLGLHYLRTRAKVAEAESNFKKAQELAPDSSEIAVLLGHFERERGKMEEARSHFERAVELDPKNVHARYTLATLIKERLRPQDADTHFQRQMEGILASRPENLVAMVELGSTAARSNDSAALGRVIDQLDARSAEWPDNVKDALAGLKAARTQPAVATSRMLVFQNLMRQQPVYLKSMRELKPLEQNAIGFPIERFLRLPSPSSDPAPPDMSVFFADEAIAGPAGYAAVIAVLSPELPSSLAETFKAKATTEGAASLLIADTSSLRIVNGNQSTQIPLAGRAGKPASVSRGIVTADLDYDFRPELILAGPFGIRILKQTGNGAYVDSTAAAKLAAEVVNSPADSAWIADVDLDGDLDIVVGYPQSGTRVLRNNGDKSFAVQKTFEAISGLRDFAWADVDGDGDPDAAFVDSLGKLTVLANDRSGRFFVRPIPDSPEQVTALAAGDVNRDLLLDLLVLTAAGEIIRFSDESDGSRWESARLAQWTGAPADAGSARLFLADLDNNGALDIVASSPSSSQAWMSDAKGDFQALTGSPGSGIQSIGDLNGDGRIDLVAIANGRALRRINTGTKKYEWITLRPRATNVARGGSGDSRFSTFAIGGQIEIRSALLAQTGLIRGPNVHYGLGENRKVDYARIIWPNGDVQGEFDLKSGQAVAAIQRLDSSCPWMFAWNGRKMAFVTDFLWRSPLGLRINAQDTAGIMTTEDWVKIRGDQLAPKDAHYDVRITGELWETHFFDQVSLMVVDHPEDTEVFVDERFVFPPPRLKVHPVSVPRRIARAVDDNGSDVTAIVKSRDGKHLDSFGRGQYQGVTRDHFLEVELPREAVTAANVCLVAFGWIYPTNSSINVALSQGSHPPPTGLSIEVPDVNGRWVTAASNLGFPSGKTKTVLLDLAGILRKFPGTSRVRLRTNLEIYWDSIEWAEWRPHVELKTERLQPTSADLRFRGFSATSQLERSSPELPDYDIIETRAQKWRDLIGFHTRFGDVRELVESVDDRYVIMNAGDELAFQFKARPKPPQGWKRDYVLIGDGWEKDGNYNTGFSKTVLPLPSHSDAKYTSPPGRLEDDPVYRRFPRDWELYHTRFVTPEAFRSVLLPKK